MPANVDCLLSIYWRAGISEHMLNAQSQQIPAHLVERLWQECENAGATRYFGCDLINSMATSTLQGLNILLDSAANLRGSLECNARYSTVVSNYVHLHLDQEGSTARLQIRPTQAQPHFFGLDAATLSLVRNMSRRVGLSASDLFSQVSLSPQQSAGDLLKGWNVRIEQGDYPCLQIPLELLDLPLLGANEFLHQSLSRQWQSVDQKNSRGDNGLITSDNIDGYNGAPDRFDWKLQGKQELFIPYNSYKIGSHALKYDEVIKPNHINQDLVRYEKHRVWVVEATLKPNARHLYAKRRFYVDEDSWQIAQSDQYDSRGELWRSGELHAIQQYDHGFTYNVLETSYDLISGRYYAGGMTNEETQPMRVGFPAKTDDYTPSDLRRGAK